MDSITSLPSPYLYYSRPMGGKLEIPVLASQSIYAQLTYVTGIPSPSGGVSLDRLQVIDSLIAQINAHRQAGTPILKREDFTKNPDDSTILELAGKAWQQQQQIVTPHLAWGAAQGLVFDLKA